MQHGRTCCKTCCCSQPQSSSRADRRNAASFHRNLRREARRRLGCMSRGACHESCIGRVRLRVQHCSAHAQCGPGKRGRVAVAAAASTSQTAPLGQEKHCRPRRPSCRQKPVSTPSHCYGGNAAKADARRLPAEVSGAESRTAHRSTRQGCRTSIRAKACRALRVVCRVVRCHVALHDAATCLPCSGRRYDYCQPSRPRAAY